MEAVENVIENIKSKIQQFTSRIHHNLNQFPQHGFASISLGLDLNNGFNTSSQSSNLNFNDIDINYSNKAKFNSNRKIRNCLGDLAVTGQIVPVDPNSDGAENLTQNNLNINNTSKGKKDIEQLPVLISEVELVGVDDDLKKVAHSVIQIKPNFQYNSDDVQREVQRVFETGYFNQIKPAAEDTRDGVKLIFKLSAFPRVKNVYMTGASAVPASVIEKAFTGLSGNTLNVNRLQAGVNEINEYYSKNGIVGFVDSIEQSEDRSINIKVKEVKISDISLQFIDPKTDEVINSGATQSQVIMRHVTTRTGQVYDKSRVKRDLSSIYQMGLFDEVQMMPGNITEDEGGGQEVALNLQVKERKSGGFSAGGGLSSSGSFEGTPPFIGYLGYTQKNLFGLNQRLSASVELGKDNVYRLIHVDPWVRSDKHRTSRTLVLQNTRVSGQPIFGRDPSEQVLPQQSSQIEGETNSQNAQNAQDVSSEHISIARQMFSLEYGRPLKRGLTGNLGFSLQRVKCMNEFKKSVTEDIYRWPVLFSQNEYDQLAIIALRGTYNGPGGNREDKRGGSQILTTVEQSIPFNKNWLKFTRFSGRVEKLIPKGPFDFLLLAKGGAVVGDLPPYEAFPIGGTNSVRGYQEGGVGTGRYYGEGHAEFRWPLPGIFQGVTFFDYGTDFNSGQLVVSDPAGARGKPGSGFGFGGGVRVDTPIGPVRLEYAYNDMLQPRFHLGIGSQF